MKTTNYTASKYPKLVKSFHDGNRNFYCPTHGKHDEWRLTVQKTGYEYIRCAICYRKAASYWNRIEVDKMLLKRAKRSAKEEGLDINIDLNYIKEKIKTQNNRCIYTSIKFDLDKNRPSIDKKNSSKGYVKGNVQFTSIPINIMKSNFSELEFLKLCKLVAKPIKNKKKTLDLLKYVKRNRTKEDDLNDLKNYKKNGKLSCDIHGEHERWYIQKIKGKVLRARCGECGLDYHKTKNSKSSEDLRKFKLKKNKTNLENIKRFNKDLKCFCPQHNFHFEFRKKTGGAHIYITCKLCEKKYREDEVKKNVFPSIFAYRKYGAKRIKRQFNLHFNDLIEMYKRQEGKCALTNITFDFTHNRPSLDRINSNKGYLKHNCQLVIYPINRSKSDLDLKEFKKQCRLVAKHN
jgi:hypothetical protein